MTEAMATAQRKALGAFYTRKDAAHYMASWAMRVSGETILEPSIGDGHFISAAHDVAASRGWRRPEFVAAEINSRATQDVVRRGLVSPDEVYGGDFLTAPIRPSDAAVGNPPYVRLRVLSIRQKRAALEASKRDLGAQMMESGSVWMPFTARTARNLKPGGRFALVLPWDFTYVKYARPLWAHLAGTFGHLRVVRVRDRLFPDISQDVLLLFADRKGGSTDHIEFEAYRTMEDLIAGTAETAAQVAVVRVVDGERVFQEALLPDGVLDVVRLAHAFTEPTRDLVTFNIGYVSGNKSFFQTEPADKAHKLPKKNLLPALTNSKSLAGGGLNTSSLAGGEVLWRPGGKLTAAEKLYIERGENLGVSAGHKTSRRKPWYVVPDVRVPDLVLSVFTNRPVLMVNDAGYVASNSLLVGFTKGIEPVVFAAGWYNSLTLLNTELEVHSLGGGVLVLVPEEAGNIRVSSATVVHAADVLPAVDAALRSGDTLGAYRAGDGLIERILGRDALRLIQEGIAELESWRLAKAS